MPLGLCMPKGCRYVVFIIIPQYDPYIISYMMHSSVMISLLCESVLNVICGYAILCNAFVESKVQENH